MKPHPDPVILPHRITTLEPLYLWCLLIHGVQDVAGETNPTALHCLSVLEFSAELWPTLGVTSRQELALKVGRRMR